MSKLLAIVLLSLAAFCVASAQPISRARQAANGARTLVWLYNHQDAYESWGTNRGPVVDKIILAGGGNPYQRKSPEWCGFTQAAANRSAGLPIPGHGMQGAARCWFTDETGKYLLPRTIYYRGRRGSIDSIAVGLKAGFDYGHGIHHVAAVAVLGRPVRAGRAPRSVWTLAGNEGKGPTAGLKLSLYPIGAIDALSNWNY